MSYIDVSGKTEDEALAKALAQLGLDRDDVSVQILERAKAGFLGLGSQPAVVRVTYGEDFDAAPAQESVSGAEEPRAERPRRFEKAPREEKKEEKPRVRRERREERQPAPAAEDAAAAVQPAVRPEMPETGAPRAAAETLGDEVDDEKAQAIRTFLSGLLSQMEAAAEVRVYLPEKGRYKVILEGGSLGALIGRRGETLDAIQQLTSYCVNRTGGRVRVQLDAENYRERREESLAHLAQKVAAKVVKYRRSVTLEPMNAYERHVIHTALQDTPDITTYSTGVEPNRRVIVAYDRDKQSGAGERA
ncbi:MAG: protein jag [Oscillibacter sp.]|jgi:spoIIIJ-associated protein|nr:protein jag [Oscillibacter sp.]